MRKNGSGLPATLLGGPRMSFEYGAAQETKEMIALQRCAVRRLMRNARQRADQRRDPLHGLGRSCGVSNSQRNLSA